MRQQFHPEYAKRLAEVATAIYVRQITSPAPATFEPRDAALDAIKLAEVFLDTLTRYIDAGVDVPDDEPA